MRLLHDPKINWFIPKSENSWIPVLKILKMQLRSKYIYFFNHDKKIKDTPESFKYVLKDLIYSYDKNVDYRDNMLSLPSSGPTNSNDAAINSRKIIYDKVINNELPLLVDTNFNIFTKEYVENNKNDFKKLLNVSDISEFIFRK
jgi:hypothetical protein